MGSNSFGQLGLDDSKTEALQFEKAEKVKHLPMKKTFCNGNASFLLTDDGEVYYLGQISAKSYIFFHMKIKLFISSRNSQIPYANRVPRRDVDQGYRWEWGRGIRYKPKGDGVLLESGQFSCF